MTVVESVLPRRLCLVAASDDLSRLPALAAAGLHGPQVRDEDVTTPELGELARVGAVSVAEHAATVVVGSGE